MSPDDESLTDKQRRVMARVVVTGLKEVRSLCWDAKSQQASSLSEVLILINSSLWSAGFPWDSCISEAKAYNDAYPKSQLDYAILLGTLREENQRRNSGD